MSCHQSLHLSFSSSARKPRSYSLFRFSAVGWGHTVAKISGWNAMWTCPRVRTIYNYIWCKAGYGGFSQVEKNLKTASNLVLFDQFPPCFNLFQAFFFLFFSWRVVVVGLVVLGAWEVALGAEISKATILFTVQVRH